MSSQTPDLLTRGSVADLLGLPLHKLTWWIWVLRPERRYRQFEIEKAASEEPRLIRAPIKPIKDIQRDLANVLMESYAPPPQVHGFVRGRNPKTNAQAHPGQIWVMRADIADFFGAINFGRVRGLFMAHPFEYSADVATLLAQICCHENELPQGAPTSPIVSNLICRGLDKQLARLAANEHCYFTRYADDMCFSTDRRDFPRGLASIREGKVVAGEKLERIINDHGFSLNAEKTRLSHKSQRQRITGLVVNHRVTVSRDYVRSLRNLLYIWNRYGKVAAEESMARAERRPNWPPAKPAPKFHLVLRGRVQHVGHIRGWDDPVYRSLARGLARADKTFKPHPPPTTSKKRVRLYTEGPSDLLHLAAAITAFHDRGEYSDLEFVVDANSSAGGDAELLTRCRSWSKVPHNEPCCCLFDTDNETVLKQAVGGAGWKDWGNGVLALAIAPPSFRSDDRLCIELLYSPELLKAQDSEGRRVYLRSEFDDRTGRHYEEDCFTPHAGKRGSLIVEQVHVTSGHDRSLALSKMEFAEAVQAKAPPYQDVDFDGFGPTFERARAALSAM